MKQITKSAAATYQWFEEWKVNTKPTTWETLQNPEKGKLREMLVKEQGYICCYCNQLIGADHKTHIEHFLAKDEELYPNEMFVYDNLHAACDGGERNPKPRETYCDNFKGNLDANLPPMLINPTEKGCEKHFFCNVKGELEGMTERGIYTIKELNLNALALKVKRERAINDYIMGILNEEMDIEDEIKQILTPSSEGKYEPFCVHIATFLPVYCLSI